MPSFTNQATLSYRGNVTISNIVTGELVAVLSATKTALSERYGADDILTYVISIVNSGPAPYTGLTMTDDLGAYTYGTGTLTPLTVPGIAVPAGGNALLIYETRVNSFAPLDTESTVTNTATLSGAGLTTPVQAASTVNARAAAYLTIGKAVSPATVAENGTLTYTFTIQNYGNTAAAETDNVTVSDTFSPILKAISVTYNGVAWTEGTQYTYNAATGAFATTAGQITVPAASLTRDAATGAVVVTPGISTLTVTGTV